jgi:hypothetical protein
MLKLKAAIRRDPGGKGAAISIALESITCTEQWPNSNRRDTAGYHLISAGGKSVESQGMEKSAPSANWLSFVDGSHFFSQGIRLMRSTERGSRVVIEQRRRFVNISARFECVAVLLIRGSFWI